MKTNINLNNQTGTYSKCISDNIQTIYSKYNDIDSTTEELRDLILEIVETASDTMAKRKFIAGINRAYSKDELVFHITNTTLRADHMSANINDKWSNER